MMCSHCKNEFIEKEIHEHHIHPRFMDNKKGDGMKIYLCKKCHDIIGGILLKLVWGQVSEGNKKILKTKIKSFTNWWIKQP